MINWPPNKAWTSKYKIKGQNHFVIINYGIREKSYWVNLVSVIDSNICFVINFDDLKNEEFWIAGWHDLKDKEGSDLIESKFFDKGYREGCLHPADDSGLSIGSNSSEKMPWFI